MLKLDYFSKDCQTCLVCIFRWATHDEGLVSRSSERDFLVKEGFVQRVSGWNIITEQGARVVIESGLVKHETFDPLNFVTSEGACYHDFAKNECPVNGCVYYGGLLAEKQANAMIANVIGKLKLIGALD